MNSTTPELPKEPFDIKALIRSYSKHWKWFIVSIVTCLLLTILILRYETPLYLAQGTIQFVENQANSQMNVFTDLDVFADQQFSRVEDEILLAKSRSNLLQVVDRLGLNVKVYTKGKIINTEIYNNLPFDINFIAPDSVLSNSYSKFGIRISTQNTFGYSENADDKFSSYQFGNPIKTKIGDLIITPNFDNFESIYGEQYIIEVLPKAVVAQYYRSQINIVPEQYLSNILGIYLSDPILQKAKDIIDELVKVHNENTIRNNKLIADKTSEFINDRINAIYSDLASVDQTAEEYKEGRRITDIGSQSALNMTEGAANEAELQNAQIQLSIAESMKDIVDNTSGYEIMPSFSGLSDPSISETNAQYNELALRRNQLLESSNENNPVIRNLDQQLNALKRTMSSSLSGITNNLNLQANSLSQRLSTINSRLYSAPGNERALRDITRKQETKEALYLYLLQKREESQIAFASSEPSVKVIDFAYSLSNTPIGLEKRILYLISIVLGVLIPFIIIYIMNLLDNKIHSKVDLEKLMGDVPVVGELPNLTRKQLKLIRVDDRSVLAEAYRILRTNLDYLLKLRPASEGKGKIIFVSSSIANEGKTFISSNLATTLSNTNKKVLLLGADIRNPKLLHFFKNNVVTKSDIALAASNIIGLSDFLFEDTINTKDIVNTIKVNTTELDVIYAGKVPPNPAELLLSERLGKLFTELKDSYDYIVVDTAPLLVVTDTLVMSKYADHILYVVRAGKTEKKILDFPLKLKKEGKLNNFSFVVNGVEQSNLGYGGKYGYGYHSVKKKPWYRWN